MLANSAEVPPCLKDMFCCRGSARLFKGFEEGGVSADLVPAEAELESL